MHMLHSLWYAHLVVDNVEHHKADATEHIIVGEPDL